MKEEAEGIKIGFVDDHPLIRYGIAILLNRKKNYTITIEADNGVDFIEKIKDLLPTSIPDVLLIDVSMPLMDGYELARWVKKNFPKIKMIALSASDDESTILEMFKNGVKSYLLKSSTTDELLKAIQSVYKHGHYLTDVSSKAFSGLVDNLGKHIKFTRRELELISYFASDKNQSEIAEAMKIGRKTLDFHRDSIYRKVGVKSRMGLVLYAVKNGIVKL